MTDSIQYECPTKGCLRTYDSPTAARQCRDSHDNQPEPLPDGGQIKKREETLRMISVCHECGVINSERRPADDPHPDPGTGIGHDHLAETGHSVRTFPYSEAPGDIQEMVDQVEPDGIDWLRIVEWMDDTESDDWTTKYKVVFTSGGIQFESERVDYETASTYADNLENAVVKHGLGEKPLCDDHHADIQGIDVLNVDIDGVEGPE